MVTQYSNIKDALNARLESVSQAEAGTDDVCRAMRREASEWFQLISDSDTRKQNLHLLMEARKQLCQYEWYEITMTVLEDVIKELLLLLNSLLEITEMQGAMGLDFNNHALIGQIGYLVEHVQDAIIPKQALKLLTQLCSVILGDGKQIPLQAYMREGQKWVNENSSHSAEVNARIIRLARKAIRERHPLGWFLCFADTTENAANRHKLTIRLQNHFRQVLHIVDQQIEAETDPDQKKLKKTDRDLQELQLDMKKEAPREIMTTEEAAALCFCVSVLLSSFSCPSCLLVESPLTGFSRHRWTSGVMGLPPP